MLIAKQKNILSRFSYDLFDSRAQMVGTIVWPDAAVATNARFKDAIPNFLNTKFQITLRDRLFNLNFEYLNRSWANDIRFFLTEGAAVIASANVLHKKWSRPEIHITSPFQGNLVPKGWLFSTNYMVYKDSNCIGSVSTKRGFTLKHEVRIDLPESVDEPTQCFLFFLMLNHAYR